MPSKRDKKYWHLFSILGNPKIPDFLITLDEPDSKQEMKKLFETFKLDEFDCSNSLEDENIIYPIDDEDIVDKLIERLYVELDIFGFYDLKKFVK